MNVLVTGANGFLGAWLVKRLNKDGVHPRILKRAQSDLSELEGAHYSECVGDVTNLDSFIRACSGVDVVFHLAGVVGYTPESRAIMKAVNVDGTKNMIQAALAQNVKRVVHLSSVVAVGASHSPHHVLDETSPFELSRYDLGYFETKRESERLVIEACQKHHLNAVILNPSTIYGAGDARKGSRKTQLKVARGRFPFYTHGGVSVVSVHDVVDVIWQARQLGQPGERYILSGDNLTIQQLFNKIAQFAGTQPPKLLLPTPLVLGLGYLGDGLRCLGHHTSLSFETSRVATLYHWFSSAKAQRCFQFKPQSADLAVLESVDWMRSKGLL